LATLAYSQREVWEGWGVHPLRLLDQLPEAQQARVILAWYRYETVTITQRYLNRLRGWLCAGRFVGRRRPGHLCGDACDRRRQALRTELEGQMAASAVTSQDDTYLLNMERHPAWTVLTNAAASVGCMSMSGIADGR
jgi:hypothetical protein